MMILTLFEAGHSSVLAVGPAGAGGVLPDAVALEEGVVAVTAAHVAHVHWARAASSPVLRHGRHLVHVHRLAHRHTQHVQTSDTDTGTDRQTYRHRHTHTRMHTTAHTYTRAHIHTYMHTRARARTHSHAHAHTHTHTHTLTHTHTHTTTLYPIHPSLSL